MDDAYLGAPCPKTDGRGTIKACIIRRWERSPLYAKMEVIEVVSLNEIKKVARECLHKGRTVSTGRHSSYRQSEKIYTYKYQNYC